MIPRHKKCTVTCYSGDRLVSDKIEKSNQPKIAPDVSQVILTTADTELNIVFI